MNTDLGPTEDDRERMGLPKIAQFLRTFADRLEAQQVQPPPEVRDVINEHFWELMDDKKDQPK